MSPLYVTTRRAWRSWVSLKATVIMQIVQMNYSKLKHEVVLSGGLPPCRYLSMWTSNVGLFGVAVKTECL